MAALWHGTIIGTSNPSEVSVCAQCTAASSQQPMSVKTWS
jgi:hypothetical protein